MANALSAPRVAPSPPLPAVLDADALFARKRAYTTKELGNARADVARVFYRHSLSRFHAGDELRFCHRGATLRQTSFNYIAYGADVCVGVDYIDRDLFVVVAPLTGTAQVEYRDRTSAIGCGQFIVLDPMQTFRWEMSADHSHLAVGIPARLVREVNAARGPAGIGLFGDGPMLITEQDIGFFEYVEYLCRELDRPNSFVAAPHVARALELSLIEMMLAALRADDDGGRDIGAAASLASPAYLARAEDFMCRSLTEEIAADDIVQAVGVPMRTLYRAFERYRGVSPKQWLQHERLERARAELAAAASRRVTVTDVATRYCASNIGRFSRAYVAQFGEPPSETLRRALSRRR